MGDLSLGKARGLAIWATHAIGGNTDDVQNVRVFGNEEIHFELWNPWPWSNSKYVLIAEDEQWVLKRKPNYVFGGGDGTVFSCSGGPSSDLGYNYEDTGVYIPRADKSCYVRSPFFASAADERKELAKLTASFPAWAKTAAAEPTFANFNAAVNEIIKSPSSATPLLLPFSKVVPKGGFYEKIETTEEEIKRAMSVLYYLAVATGEVKDTAVGSEDAALMLSLFIMARQFLIYPIVVDPMQGLMLSLIKYVESRVADFECNKTGEGLKVASIQFDSKFAMSDEAMVENIEGLAALAEEAAQNGAVLIVTPETAVQGYVDVEFPNDPDISSPGVAGYFFDRAVRHFWCHRSRYPDCPSYSNGKSFVDVSPRALLKNSDELQVFADISSAYDVYIAVGYIEKSDETGKELIYNSVNVYDPEGNIGYHYRKTYLYGTVDDYVFTKAELPSRPYFDTDFGRVSAAICFDGNFILKELAPFDIDILLYPVAWVSSNVVYSPNYTIVGNHVQLFHIAIVMANWVFDNGPPMDITMTCDGMEESLQIMTPITSAELNGSGRSYVMDKNGAFRAISTNNVDSTIIYGNLPHLIP